MIDRRIAVAALFAMAAQTSPSRGVQEEAAAGPSPRSLIQAAGDLLDQLEETEAPQRKWALLDDANRQIEALQASDPASPWLGFLRGRTLALVGRQGDAIEQLQRFVNTREGRSEWKAYRLLGDLLVREFPRLARSNYRKAAALKDNDPATIFGLSVCEAMLGSIAEAIDLATRATALDQHRTVSYVAHLAKLLRQAERYDDAIREAGAALDLARNEARRQRAPAALKALYDHYGLLIVIIEERLAVTEQGGSDDYLRLATLLKERGRVAMDMSMHEAVAALEAGIERMDPDVPPALLERYGTDLAGAGRTDDAIAAFQRLLAADPGNRAATEALRKLKSDAHP